MCLAALFAIAWTHFLKTHLIIFSPLANSYPPGKDIYFI
ncbi:hypothetical protein CAMRE0001_0848 [Campylobacter rectus RM3267]|uniref:Uncharacterized protein n=1 Tax=Campylobacter rectus RM3267 TaxID=553218 RepID=B9D4Y4_CAMRE|nr:hypothetical protein CAMRE0001_0848 [Campylobacter rectus RM3267]